MTREIVPYLLSHNAEAEACDLIMEIEQTELLINMVNKSVYHRVCLYLTRCDMPLLVSDVYAA